MAGLENYCTLIITYDIEKLWKKKWNKEEGEQLCGRF